jgi:hypothetical protein
MNDKFRCEKCHFCVYSGGDLGMSKEYYCGHGQESKPLPHYPIKPFDCSLEPVLAITFANLATSGEYLTFKSDLTVPTFVNCPSVQALESFTFEEYRQLKEENSILHQQVATLIEINEQSHALIRNYRGLYVATDQALKDLMRGRHVG